MADFYVWDGATGTADGSTWDNAFTTLGAGITGMSAGDTLYVASDHNETLSASTEYSLPALTTASSSIISKNRTSGVAEPGAKLTSNGNFYISFTMASADRWMYINGLHFVVGNTGIGSSKYFACNSRSYSTAMYENCTFESGGTSANFNFIRLFRTSSNPFVIMKGCVFIPNEATQYIGTSNIGPQRLLVINCSVNTSKATPVSLFNVSANDLYEVRGCDFSNLGSGDLVRFPSRSVFGGQIFINNKVTDVIGSSDRLSVVSGYNSSNTTSTHQYEAYGDVTRSVSTAVYRDGGAESAGLVPLSWSLDSNVGSNHLSYYFPQSTPEITFWNESVGSSITATIEIVTDDNITLKNDEIWVEVEYYGSATGTNSSFIDNKMVLLGTPANQPSSSVDWTTTGMTNPIKQKLSVTFTPQLKGIISARVYLARNSTLVYVDPKIVIT